MEISEFQTLMSEMYAHNDRRRGGKATMLWLVEEIGELAEAIRREEPKNIEEELADCFAWIGALANLYGVNLEGAFLKNILESAPPAGKSPVSVLTEYRV